MIGEMYYNEKKSCTITVTLKGNTQQKISMLLLVNSNDVVPEMDEKFILEINQEASIMFKTDSLSFSNNSKDTHTIIETLKPHLLSVVFRLRRMINAFIRKVEIKQLEVNLHDKYWDGFLLSFAYALKNLINKTKPRADEIFRDQWNNEWVINNYESFIKQLK